MSQKQSQLPTPTSIDRQLQAVLALAEINRKVREGLRARFVERQAKPTSNGRPFTMRRLALEVGCAWEFIRNVHDGGKAFGVSNSGDKVIKYLGLERDWQAVKAACDHVPLADSMVSIALFPPHLIHLVFRLKKTFVVAREQHEAVMADVAQALEISATDFEALYYGKNTLVEAIDPNQDETGERYLALRAKFDNEIVLTEAIVRVVAERLANVQRMQAELDMLRDQLLANGKYSSEMDISSKLLGRPGALASLRGDEGFSVQRYEDYRRKLTAELERLQVKKGGTHKGSTVPPVIVEEPTKVRSSVEELTDAVEQAVIGGMRLSIGLVKSQIVFLLGLSDKQSMRFGRIWGTLTDEIEDLREHLQALYAETPSAAREKLARLQRERASRSVTGLIGGNKKT